MTQAAKPTVENATPERGTHQRAKVISMGEGLYGLIIDTNAPEFLTATGNRSIFNTKGRYIDLGPNHELQVNVRPRKVAARPNLGLTYEDE